MSTHWMPVTTWLYAYKQAIKTTEKWFRHVWQKKKSANMQKTPQLGFYVPQAEQVCKKDLFSLSSSPAVHPNTCYWEWRGPLGKGSKRGTKQQKSPHTTGQALPQMQEEWDFSWFPLLTKAPTTAAFHKLSSIQSAEDPTPCEVRVSQLISQRYKIQNWNVGLK